MSPQPFQTLVELYERSVSLYANNQLFGVKRDGRYRWITYGDFAERVEACCGGLAELGVGPGDTVSIIANNRVEWAVAAYATYCRGASFCPMYESQLAKDWEYILEDSSSKVVIVANNEIYDQVKGFTETLDALKRVIVLDAEGEHQEDSFEALLKLGEQHPVAHIKPSPQDVAGFIYTSGTTGKPKGVLLSHENIAFNVGGVLDIDLILPTDVSLAFLPWAHSFGQNCELHVLFALGASMGLVESVQTIITNLSEVRPTALFAVPRIFNRIYDGLNKRMEQESPVKRKLFEAAMKNSDALRDQIAQNRTSLLTNVLDKAYDRIIFEKVRERFGGRLRFCISGGAALSPEVARFIDNLHLGRL